MGEKEKINDLSSNKSQKIEEFITSWMSSSKTPGLSISIVKDGKIIYADGFGSRNLKKNRPATAETLYGIGSCTKSFTALAIMKLVERGELKIEDAISEYVPVNWENDVTIHDLLTHSSGMPSLGVSVVMIERLADIKEKGVPLCGLDDFYILLSNAKEEIAAEPGEEFFYFNSGYSLLGQIIEEVSGITFSEFINQEILEPLNMNRSTFEYEKDESVTTPYMIKDEEPVETPYPLREIGYPAGGLLSSAVELSNYLIMNMNDGEFKGKNIIESDLLKKMHKSHVSGNLGKYGYGWMIKEFQDQKFVGHGGSIGVGGGFIGFKDDIGVAIVANAVPSGSVAYEEMAKKVIQIIEEKEEDLVYFKRKENLDKLTGTYSSYRDIMEVDIEKKYGLLELEVKGDLGGQKLILIPEEKSVDDLKFYYLDGKGEKNSVRFEMADEKTDLYFGRYRLHKKN